MRNPSKNTIKKLMRPVNGMYPGWGYRHTNYFFFNKVGQRVWEISKGHICNREPKGWLRYIPAKNREMILEFTRSYYSK